MVVSMKPPCDGPVSDDTGILICPRQPEVIEFNCEECRGLYQLAADLAVDRYLEDKAMDEEFIKWGE